VVLPLLTILSSVGVAAGVLLVMLELLALLEELVVSELALVWP
jgi:hypothetical protein